LAIKPHKLYLSLIICFSSVGFAVSEDSEEDSPSLCSNIALGLARQLAPQVGPLRADIAKLIDDEIAKVPRRKRKAFIAALRDTYIFTGGDFEAGVLSAQPWFDRILESNYIAYQSYLGKEKTIPYEPWRKKTLLIFSRDILNHPVTKIIVVHEFSHLRRMVNAYGRSDILEYLKSNFKKDGYLNEERKAIADEYRYINKYLSSNSGMKDLSKVKQDLKSNHEMLSSIDGLSLTKLRSGRSQLIMRKKVSKEEVVKIKRAILSINLAGQFLNYTKAAELSLEEYIKHTLELGNYSKDQDELNVKMRAKLKTAGYTVAGLGAAGLAVSTASSYLTWMFFL